jgi:hypothetical protein
MIPGLTELSPMMQRHVVRLIEAVKASAANLCLRSIGLHTALTPGAIMRAAVFFRVNISSADEDVDEAGTAFVGAWCLAEREALRRAMVAITSPGAKGREIEVVQALMDGASITEAVAKRDSAPVTENGSVVAFPSRRVTSTREVE